MPNKNTQKIHRVPIYQRPLVIISFLLILAAVVALTIWVFSTFSHPDSAPSTPDSPKDSTSRPESKPSSDSNPDKPTEEPQRPSQFEGEDPNELSGLTGSITLNTHDANTLTIAVSIDQYLSQPGLCQLKLLQGGKVIRSAEVKSVADVTTSGCGPFSIPISGLSSGQYQIEITISGDGKSGLVKGEVNL